MPSPHWLFSPFRLDPANARLWHGAQAVPLTPKAYDVLFYLVIHPDRLVTKDALLDAVWPEAAVSEAALRVCIGELRKALGDTVREQPAAAAAPPVPPVPEEMPVLPP